MALPLKFKETLLCSLWIWKYNSVWRGTSITFNFSIPTPTVSLLHCFAGSFYYSYDVWTDTIAVPRCERLFDALTNSFLIWIAALLATLLQSNHPWPSTRLFLIFLFMAKLVLYFFDQLWIEICRWYLFWGQGMISTHTLHWTRVSTDQWFRPDPISFTFKDRESSSKSLKSA